MYFITQNKRKYTDLKLCLHYLLSAHTDLCMQISEVELVDLMCCIHFKSPFVREDFLASATHG